MNPRETQNRLLEGSNEASQESLLVLDEEEEHKEYKSLWQVIKLPLWEYPIVLLLLGATVTMFILHAKDPESSGLTIGLVVSAALFGVWLAFRPSEWAVDGLDNLMRYLGLTAYVAGVISSLASNLPEGVTGGILLIKGAYFSATPNIELIEIAIYTTLAAAGFNSILLGIVVIVGSKGKGHVELKKETIMAEGVLLRWGFVAMLLTFGIGTIVLIDEIFVGLKTGTPFGDELTAELPRMAGVALVTSYVIYLIFLIVKSKQAKAALIIDEKKRTTTPTRGKLDEKMPDKLPMKIGMAEEATASKLPDTPSEINVSDARVIYATIDKSSQKRVIDPYISAPHMEHPHLTMTSSIVLVILGIGGIAGGGYLLSHAVETGLEHPAINLEGGLMAMIVGFAGAVPEHGIAVVAAIRGKTDVALGNLLGGILQMTLLIFGTFAIIVKAPINDFILFQIVALGGIIWFIKRAMTDDGRISTYEGIMIILAQLFAFLLLLGELTGLKFF